MKDHFWEYTSGKIYCAVEFAYYSTRRAMRVGIVRDRKRKDYRISKKGTQAEHTCDALCRTWIERIDRRKVPVARIYLSEEDYSPGVLAHEAFHAAKFIIECFHRKKLHEEHCALLLEKIVNDFTRWKDQGFSDEIKGD